MRSRLLKCLTDVRTKRQTPLSLTTAARTPRRAAMALRHLFATPIYEASLSTDPNFENFRAELEAACRMLAQEDAAGRAWSRAHGYGGGTRPGRAHPPPPPAGAPPPGSRSRDSHP